MSQPANLFRALADETRLQILVLIRQHGELCVCDLVHVLSITQSKASRHLRYLLNAGLVLDRRDAVWMHYRIADHLNPAQTAVLECVEKMLDSKTIHTLNTRLTAWEKQKKNRPPRPSVKAVRLEVLK